MMAAVAIGKEAEESVTPKYQIRLSLKKQKQKQNPLDWR